jgi:hypothetical protein
MRRLFSSIAVNSPSLRPIRNDWSYHRFMYFRFGVFFFRNFDFISFALAYYALLPFATVREYTVVN